MTLELILRKGTQTELMHDLFEYASYVSARVPEDMEQQKMRYLGKVQDYITGKYSISADEFRINHFRYITDYGVAKYFQSNDNNNLPPKNE